MYGTGETDEKRANGHLRQHIRMARKQYMTCNTISDSISILAKKNTQKLYLSKISKC